MAAPVIIEYTANSLGEFFDKIDLIKRICLHKKESPVYSPLWFRGQECNEYTLLPTMFRNEETPANKEKTYSAAHLGEDYRYQSFRSRAYHHIDSRPESRIEWQEIMQHHFVWTRLMDWSESAISGLLFALDPYINPVSNLTNQHRRIHDTPVVWVLSPYNLNKLVYKTLISKEDGKFKFIEDSLNDLLLKNNSKRRKLANAIGTELADNIKRYFSSFTANIDVNKNKDKAVIDGLIGLSVIDSYRQANSSRLLEMINRFEFNPFFYLLARYYSDGICTPVSEANQLPPLAIIHPYHSNRIKAQRGAFTVFPYYCSAEKGHTIDEYKAMGTDLRAMEYQLEVRKCIFKIRICNAHRVAWELLQIGEKRSSIYPELERYADDIESVTYHV